MSAAVADDIDLYAVVPAAGVGSRMNLSVPKQLVEIDGQAVILKTVNRLLAISALQKVVIVAEPAFADQINAQPFTNKNKIEICTGGASRAQSVLNGLKHIQNTAGSNAFVLVHDAARPCVRMTDIKCLIEQCCDDDGGLLAMRVSDTIKLANQHQQSIDTLDRDALWRAATPQMFNLQLLYKALSSALQQNIAITDEASAMQHAGYIPRLIECHSDNIKITTAPDLVLAEYYLDAQKNNQ